MNILVTGAKGMIGSHLVKGLLDAGYKVIGVDRTDDTVQRNSYFHYRLDLADKGYLEKIIKDNHIDRIIHLAALAHSQDGSEFTWKDYAHLNINCAKNVFESAREIPVLFISTVDVFGFTKGVVNTKTELHPVSNYAKSKKIAEEECAKLKHYTIFRFSPVYTETVKRDIQKRYYLKYPNIAYQIGSGTYYEILNVKLAVKAMIDWCKEEPKNNIRIIKDPKPMWTPEYIKKEKDAGRATIVLYFPRWAVDLAYRIFKVVTGENKYTYLLHKAVSPLKSE